MAEVRMSMEEYEALLAETRATNLRRVVSGLNEVKAKKKRVGKKDPKMARALRKANAMGRKKNGGFKKGWSQGKIMRKAHQLRRKMR